ncbi:hypothetical protein CISIN_1g0436802mg, partial [Citrus sinensis]
MPSPTLLLPLLSSSPPSLFLF